MIAKFVYESERKRKIKLDGPEKEQKRIEQVQTEPLSTAVATRSNSRQNSSIHASIPSRASSRRCSRWRRGQALRFAIPCNRPFLLSRRARAAVPAPFVDSFQPLQRKSSPNCTPTSQPISSPKFAGFRPSPPTPSAATTPLR